jgi:hypothetical protein
MRSRGGSSSYHRRGKMSMLLVLIESNKGCMLYSRMMRVWRLPGKAHLKNISTTFL